MIFDFFSNETNDKPEFVSDETLTEAMQVIISILQLQISTAKEMSLSMPDGEERFNALLGNSSFYGYVFGLCNSISIEQFSEIIDKKNMSKNISRLIQGVVANLYYPDTEPDWDAVLTWEAKVTEFWLAKNNSYIEGMKKGALLGNEILTNTNTSSITLLGAELLNPL